MMPAFPAKSSGALIASRQKLPRPVVLTTGTRSVQVYGASVSVVPRNLIAVVSHLHMLRATASCYLQPFAFRMGILYADGETINLYAGAAVVDGHLRAATWTVRQGVLVKAGSRWPKEDEVSR